MNKANIPSYNGQELFIYQGMLVYALEFEHDAEQIRLAEFMGSPQGDIYVISIYEYLKLSSATPEELKEMGI